MSVLMDVLQEEAGRLERVIEKSQNEYDSLPKGYISKKTINGKFRYYLQYRENKKIISKYLRESEVEGYQVLIQRRRELKKDISEMQIDLQKIKRAIK